MTTLGTQSEKLRQEKQDKQEQKEREKLANSRKLAANGIIAKTEPCLRKLRATLIRPDVSFAPQRSCAFGLTGVCSYQEI